MTQPVPAEQSFAHEPAPLEETDHADIIPVGHREDPSQAEVFEGVPHQPPDGPRAVAASPGILLAYEQVHLGAALDGVDLHQLYLADRPPLRRIDAPGLGERVRLHAFVAFAHGLFRAKLRRIFGELKPVQDVGIEHPPR